MTDYHLPIMPANDDGTMNWQDLVGAGAYKIDKYDAGVSTALSRHGNHWSDAVGHLDTVEVLSIIDTNARTAAMASGDVQAIDRVDLKTAELMGRKPGVNLVTATGTLHYSLPMLTDTAPYDDNNIRLAIKYAVNRQEIVDKNLHTNHLKGFVCSMFRTSLSVATSHACDQRYMHANKTLKNGINVLLYSCTN